MGKKRIITKSAGDIKSSSGSGSKSAKRQVISGQVSIVASFNNTIITVADKNGEVLAWSSAGSLGFKGARKSTPYAATLVSKDVIEKSKRFNFQQATITVRGVGPGREAAIRGVAAAGIDITAISDATPIPHNGVRAPKPRRI